MKKNMLNFTEEFNLMKDYNENSDKGYIIEVDVEYPKTSNDLHNHLPFLSERMKINKCDINVISLYAIYMIKQISC